MFHRCRAHANPDSKVHGANMGTIWDRQDQGGPQVGPMNFAIWDSNTTKNYVGMGLPYSALTMAMLFVPLLH